FNADGSDVLRDPLQSVQLTGLLLAKLWEDQVAAVAQGRQLNTIDCMRRAALFNYAGAATRPANAPVVDKWLACMRALQGLKLSAPPLQLPPALAGGFKRALGLARAGEWQGEDRNVLA